MDLFKHMSKSMQRSDSHKIRPDVLALNDIERYGLVSPRVTQDLEKSREVKFAFLPDDKVLLLASVDGWFPYWASVTDVDDVGTNTAIADAVLFGDFSTFTSTYPKLENLMSHRYRRWFHVSGGHIKTPFEYGFSEEPDQLQNWGGWLAKGVSRHYREIRELCKLRELDGRYLPLLRSYLGMLDARTSDDDARNYEDKRMLIKLLTSEDYLYVSDDEAVRSAYVEARKKIDNLHSHYMSIAK